MKKFLSLLLAIAMVFSAIPFAMAEEGQPEAVEPAAEVSQPAEPAKEVAQPAVNADESKKDDSEASKIEAKGTETATAPEEAVAVEDDSNNTEEKKQTEAKDVTETEEKENTEQIPEHEHTTDLLTHYPVKDSTCTETGCIEYWYCETCHKYYVIEEGKLVLKKLEDIVIPVVDHTYDENSICTVCGANKSDINVPATLGSVVKDSNYSQQADEVNDADDIVVPELTTVVNPTTMKMAMALAPLAGDSGDALGVLMMTSAAPAFTAASPTMATAPAPADPGYIFDKDTLTVLKDVVKADYTSSTYNTRPWQADAANIKNIVIGSAVTRIGDYEFYKLQNLLHVDIFSKDIQIGDYAFAEDTKLEYVNLLDTNAVVTYDITPDVPSQGKNSITAYSGDGTVSINYRCNNKKANEQKRTQKFDNVTITHEDLHLNCKVSKKVKPTEDEFGRTAGVYCKDCKTWIIPREKIYPTGKETTGKYNFRLIRNVEKAELDPDKAGGKFESFAELKDSYQANLEKQIADKTDKELNKKNIRIYDVSRREDDENPKTHVITIPYPYGTSADKNEFFVSQANTKGETKELKVSKTNKGIQVESDNLNYVGVAWVKSN